MRMDVRFQCQARRAGPARPQSSALASRIWRVKETWSTSCRVPATWGHHRQKEWPWSPAPRAVRAEASPFRPRLSRTRRAVTGSRCERTLSCPGCPRTRGAHPAGPRLPARSRERHLGSGDRVGQIGRGVLPGHRRAHPAPCRRHARHHQPLRASAPPRTARGSGRRGDRRNRQVQRPHLPGLLPLRPGQGIGEPDGVRPGARTEAARCDRRVTHARLAALRGHARYLRRHRGELARG
jgi:hypothetical protein